MVKFEVYSVNGSGYKFDFKGSNGKVILTSALIPSKDDCYRRISILKNQSKNFDNFIRYQKPNGSYYFELKESPETTIKSRDYLSLSTLRGCMLRINRKMSLAEVFEVIKENI